MDKQEIPNPRLEVPSDAAISMRKETMMERLLASKKTPKTSRVETSSVLSRVKAFLPQMKVANEELSTMDLQSVQVDSVPDDATSYIEMNLGVYSDDEDSDEETPNKEESESDTDSDKDGSSTGLKFPGVTTSKSPLVQVMEPEADKNA